MSLDLLIIGAGVSGLAAADRIRQLRPETNLLVLEKARGPGGRTATRRDGESRFDHGAQFFTTKSDVFREWIQPSQQNHSVREWFRGSPDRDAPADSDGHVRFCGSSGMNQIAKALAEDLPTRYQTQVMGVKRQSGVWSIDLGEGGSLETRRLLITAPVPQALDWPGLRPLLPEAAQVALDRIDYARCIAALLHLDQATGLPNQGALRLSTEPLEWLGDNQRKGISPTPTLTLHSTDAFARAHWDASDEVRLPPLLEAAQPLIAPARVISTKGHRWKFSKPTVVHPERHLILSEIGLAFAGDGFQGSRVEGAILSGLSVAEALIAATR